MFSSHYEKWRVFFIIIIISPKLKEILILHFEGHFFMENL